MLRALSRSAGSGPRWTRACSDRTGGRDRTSASASSTCSNWQLVGEVVLEPELDPVEAGGAGKDGIAPLEIGEDIGLAAPGRPPPGGRHEGAATRPDRPSPAPAPRGGRPAGEDFRVGTECGEGRACDVAVGHDEYGHGSSVAAAAGRVVAPGREGAVHDGSGGGRRQGLRHMRSGARAAAQPGD